MNYSNQSYLPYAFPFGDTEIVVVSDGPLDLGAPEDSFRGLAKKEIHEQLLRNFLPVDKVVIEQKYSNTYVGREKNPVRNRNGVAQNVRSALHRLQTSLQEAGIDPGSINAIVCSHPHPDHIGGFVMTMVYHSFLTLRFI